MKVKKEGLLKRFKNIENNHEQQLEAIREEGWKQQDASGKDNTDRTKNPKKSKKQ